jgi:hypothetical protein
MAPLVIIRAAFLGLCVTRAFAFVSLHPACHLPATSTTVAAMTTASEQQNPSRIFLAYPLTQVVSDIDDTLKSSGGLEIGGVSLGGVDVQYDRGDFYPGVFQFMWELSLHTIRLNQRHYGQYKIERGGENSFSDLRLSPPKVAVLTARAEELKAALEIKDKSKLAQAFRKTGESSIIYPTKEWGVGPVLYGSVSEWIIQNKKGHRKFRYSPFSSSSSSLSEFSP